MMRRLPVSILVVALTLGVATSALASGRRIMCFPAQTYNRVPFHGNYGDSMRFQTFIDQSRIGYAGDINRIFYNSYDGRSGRFDRFVVFLCHTRRTSLSTVFDNNYYGTPRRVRDPSSFTTPGRKGWFSLGITRTFAYNNINNLLVEVRYHGDNGVGTGVWVTRPMSGNRRIYAHNRTATTGAGDGIAYHVYLYINYYTAMEPTSLGRVKNMYR